MATFEDNASSHSHHERHDGADDDVEDDDDCEFKLEPFSLNVVAANERFDSLRKIDCAQAFSSNVKMSGDSIFNITLVAGPRARELGLIDPLFQLLKTNMEDLYNRTGWNWSDAKKLRELSHDMARFLIVTRDPLPSSTTCDEDTVGTIHDAATLVERTASIVAFSHFRFEVENSIDVVYCYEMQVAASARGFGIGSKLVQTLEAIGQNCRMKKLMLTVHFENAAAMAFYRTVGFTVDECSPSICWPDEESSYEIMSKPIPPPSKRKLGADGRSVDASPHSPKKQRYE